MKGRSKALLGLGMAVCLMLGFWLWSSERSRLAAEIGRLQAATKDLEQRLRAAEAARPAAPAPVGAIEPAPSPPAAPRHTGPGSDAATRAELIRLLDDKQQKLSAVQNSLSEAEARQAELEARIEQLTLEHRNLSRAEAELKERVDNQVRLAAALQAELKDRGERTLQLELANRDLRRRVEEITGKVSALVRTAGEIDELARRREVYLTSILRRYREVTDLYRGAALRAETPGADQTRIQNAIAGADEDLKQLQALNAQADRLHRALADARQAAR
jgi:DNA repair exonuclease SbcCD ATPase subunit